ncbi:hypothetical protein RHMOL_Rhmol02G0183300 [Rhododendron molle]|uniref:Uncharacterized protein n=1 Tax=Rhododendron molle TaxID=49168 RepID=A0ACC0PUL7_RHOML|nr:hypothetical protein RHMOL_Rhmol02G0183300 [Rhododendron molle]
MGSADNSEGAEVGVPKKLRFHCLPIAVVTPLLLIARCPSVINPTLQPSLRHLYLADKVDIEDLTAEQRYFYASLRV